MDRKRVTIYLPEDLLRKLKLYCVNKNIAMTHYVEQLVEEGLKKDADN